MQSCLNKCDKRGDYHHASPCKNFFLNIVLTDREIAMRNLQATLALLALTVLSSVARADTVAYVVPARTIGNQDFGGALGMDFNVNATAIVVSQLGVFDSESNGLANALTAQLYNRDTGLPVTPLLTFAAGSGPASGTLIGGSRFLPITPVELPAGFHGTMVASHYSGAEPDGNTFGGGASWTTDSGGGLLSFVGGARYSFSADVFPTNIDGGPANRYAAGTFVFAAVPEPFALFLLGLGSLGLLGYGWRRKHAA
jgi:hypothetical protein